VGVFDCVYINLIGRLTPLSSLRPLIGIIGLGIGTFGTTLESGGIDGRIDSGLGTPDSLRIIML